MALRDFSLANAFVNRILKHCPEVPREAWMPETGTAEECQRPSQLATKFGGLDPWMAADETWPRCPEYPDAFMTFLGQLNMEDVPVMMQVNAMLSVTTDSMTSESGMSSQS